MSRRHWAAYKDNTQQERIRTFRLSLATLVAQSTSLRRLQVSILKNTGLAALSMGMAWAEEDLAMYNF